MALLQYLMDQNSLAIPNLNIQNDEIQNNQNLNTTTYTDECAEDSSNPFVPCSVCGRRGEKMHYGAITCNACRTFFRRKVRLNLQPKCAFYGTCLFDRQSERIACIKCRFDKCLAVGMKREAVQPKRDSIKHLVSKTNSKEDIKLPNLEEQSCSSNSPPSTSMYSKDPMASLNQATEAKSLSSLCRIKRSAVQVVDVPVASKVSINTPGLAAVLPREEWQICLSVALSINRRQRQNLRTTVQHDSELSTALHGWCSVAGILPTSVQNGDILHLLLKTQGISIIEGAKNIDLFSECSLNTQVALLKSFSPADIILDDLRCSKSLIDNIIVVPENLNVINQRRDIPLFCHIAEEVMPHFESIDPDEIEIALLKRIVFWNSDIPELFDHRRVRERQLKWIYVLEQYICNKLTDNQYNRLASMVMLAGKLQRITPNFRKHVETFVSGADPHVVELFMRP